MLIGTAAFAVEDYGYYRDDFPDYVYNGSSGNLDWSKSPWQEYNDDGNVKTGAVHVDHTPEFCADEYKCLHLYSEGPLPEPVGVKRYADISMMETAELCFEMTTQGDVSGARVKVFATNGDGWVPIETFDAPDSYLHPIIDVSDFISEKFGIRFELSGEIYGGEIFVDSVEVKGSFATPPPTSTSTTSTSTTSTSTTSTSTTSTSTTSTSTTSTSTTTTTLATTTTSKPSQTTTTSKPKQTTTTKPRSTATTTEPRSTSTTTDRRTTTTDAATTTTVPATTTTTAAAVVGLPTDPPDGSGLREASAGIQFDHEGGMAGEMTMDKPEVLGVSLNVDYKMAVEFIEQSWMWMVGLLLVIATAIVTGLDRRRARTFPEKV